MNADNELDQVRVRALVHVAGLTLSDDEMQRLIGLHEHFTTERAALAGAAVGESEPVTIFQASPREHRP